MEQFIYALTDKGYVLSKSDGVDTLLTQDSIRKLCALTESKDQWFPEEKKPCIALSEVKQVTDNFQRKGVFNHTLVIPILEYLGYTQPSRLLSEHRWNGGQIPATLEAIKL